MAKDCKNCGQNYWEHHLKDFWVTCSDEKNKFSEVKE